MRLWAARCRIQPRPRGGPIRLPAFTFAVPLKLLAPDSVSEEFAILVNVPEPVTAPAKTVDEALPTVSAPAPMAAVVPATPVSEPIVVVAPLRLSVAPEFASVTAVAAGRN